MIEISLGQAALAAIAAFGIPSALTGFLFKRFLHKMELRDKQREQQEAEREQLQLLIIQALMSSLSLSEATALALERTPEINCNGEMKAAKEGAQKVKLMVRQFMETAAVKAVIK